MTTRKTERSVPRRRAGPALAVDNAFHANVALEPEAELIADRTRCALVLMKSAAIHHRLVVLLARFVKRKVAEPPLDHVQECWVGVRRARPNGKQCQRVLVRRDDAYNVLQQTTDTVVDARLLPQHRLELALVRFNADVCDVAGREVLVAAGTRPHIGTRKPAIGHVRDNLGRVLLSVVLERILVALKGALV